MTTEDGEKYVKRILLLNNGVGKLSRIKSDLFGLFKSSEILESLEQKGIISLFDDEKGYTRIKLNDSVFNEMKEREEESNQQILATNRISGYDYTLLEYLFKNGETFVAVLPRYLIDLAPQYQNSSSSGNFHQAIFRLSKFIEQQNNHSSIKLTNLGEMHFRDLSIEKDEKNTLSNRERQKLETEISLLTNQLVDYPNVVRERDRNKIIAIVSVLLAIAGFIYGLVKDC